MSEDQIDDIRQQEEEDPQGDGDIEIPAARLHHSGGRQDPGITLDIPTDHNRGSDLRDHSAKSCHYCCQKGKPGLFDQDPDHLEVCCSKGQNLKPELRRQLLNGRHGDAHHDGCSNNRLSNDHRSRQGIDWGAEDGESVRLVLLMLSPPGTPAAAHLASVARTAAASRPARVRQRLLDSEHPEAVAALLREVLS